MTPRRIHTVVALMGTLSSAAVAQRPAPAIDSLRLRGLHEEATQRDPRQRQIGLHATASELRLRNIATTKLPSVNGSGLAQYQSAVTHFDVRLPNVTIPAPPHDTYDGHLDVHQSLLNPTLAPQQSLERARLAESQAEVRTLVFARREDVNEAFFAAALTEGRIREILAAITDLETRLREAAVRFREGAALPSDTAVVAATILQRRQDLYQARADHHAAVARLSELTGRAIADTAPTVVPDLSRAVAQALGALDQLRARPEYEQFSASRDRLARQEQLARAQDKPQVAAFARLGYGRPGLNVLSSTFSSYWLGGIQVQWSPWNWGTTEHDREELEIQREIISTNEAAFTQTLHRGIQQSIATIAGLDSTLALDDRIIALRERIETEARAKLTEGVITAAEYADRSTDVLNARLARAQHRVQLGHARATLLTTLGVEIP